MAKALGAVPLIPMPDMYQAPIKAWWMRSRSVGGGADPPLRSREVPHDRSFTFYFSLCANRQKMESLPKDVRCHHECERSEGSKFWGKNFFDSAEGGVIEKAKAGNYEINRYSPPPDEVARWTKVAGEPIWEEWVKKMEGKGHKEARDILKSTLDLLKK